MSIKIALAGNPNCGKTTLFNALTGSNQYVGNWPGVTVEKKEGNLKKHDGVIITDLPGIYSLSPYTLEEVVARNYLIGEHPDAILNIIDGTNLERNLYLTTQLTEIGIPVVLAVNMMDVVRKNGDKINMDALAKAMGCKAVEISALKGDGIIEAAEAAIAAAKESTTVPQHSFSGPVEHALAHIEEAALHELPEQTQRWYSIKIFERDSKALEQLGLDKNVLDHIEKDIKSVEIEMDDDSEAIIINERYNYVSKIIGRCLEKKNKNGLTTSDKIDRIVTSRVLGLPIFAVIMFLIYYLSMVAVGANASQWANDGLFGEGWHLLGNGTSQYEEAEEKYGDTDAILNGFLEQADSDGYDITAAEDATDIESDDFDSEIAVKEFNTLLANYTDENFEFGYEVENEDTLEVSDKNATIADAEEAVALFKEYDGKVDPANFGTWVPGVPVLIEKALGDNCPGWLHGLLIDGIVAGVGAVLGFVPQIFVLFLLLAIVESCGYMSRVAFVLDRLFRKFGLSGKSFIPILVGTGCGVPGIMASRTIENVRDRRMTIITTTFIPCGAKTPVIAMIAGAIFGGSAWVAVSAYFLGMAAIIISGIILKKTKMFAGEDSPFVMELPAYHMPIPSNVLRSMWDRGWAFVKKAGTVILLSTIVVWFLSRFGTVNGSFGLLEEDELDHSILAFVGKGIAWMFAPLGWGEWQAAVSSVIGLTAKENIVATMGTLYGGGESSVYAAIADNFTKISGYSFLAFNLLCAPCFAAIGAIKREMNNGKWTWFAILYQCGFAYLTAFVINQLGRFFTGGASGVGYIGVVIAFAILAAAVYLLVRPYRDTIKKAE